MKRIFGISLIMIALVFASCSKPPTADDRFVELSKTFLEDYLSLHPETATYLGDHRFDAQLDDYSSNGMTEAVALAKRYLDSLKTIDVAALNADNRIDYDILMHNLNYEIFTIEVLQPQVHNPMMYNPGNAVYSVVAREFAPLPERMQSVKGRLLAIPGMLAEARRNLVNPPAIHTETAIAQNAGTISLLKDGLQSFIDSVPEAQRGELIAARDSAVAALGAFSVWMQNELLPNSKGDFRLGKDLFDQKLAYVTDSDVTAEEILAAAESDLVETTNALYETAKEIYKKYTGKDVPLGDTPEIRREVIKAVLDGIANDHPTNETIVQACKDILQKAENFVREHDIVTVPNDPMEIIVMPEFQRGVAVAYCDSPGPLEKNGKTFFAISPTPKDWSEERVNSFFREYNTYMLHNLTVHEAMPGHYLQLMTGNKFKAQTVLRGVFTSGIYAEGWATYTEQVMAAEGFAGPEYKMQQLKMRLRLLINAIIDQKIHTAGMTEQEAMDLMMKQGFQEEGEAAGKWRRACLTSGQLSTYFVGNMQINDIRKRYEEKMGDAFNMKEFHDQLISYGTISPKYFTTLLKLPVKESTPAQAEQ